MWPYSLAGKGLLARYSGLGFLQSTDQVLRRFRIAQMIKIVISLVCLSAIFQACNDPVWFFPHLVTRKIHGVPAEE
jgi:hypothetical protein